MTTSTTYLIERRLVDNGQLIDATYVDTNERPFTLRTALDTAALTRRILGRDDAHRYLIQIVDEDRHGHRTVVDEAEAARPWWQRDTEYASTTSELAMRLRELADALEVGGDAELGIVSLTVSLVPTAYGEQRDLTRAGTVSTLAARLGLTVKTRPPYNGVVTGMWHIGAEGSHDVTVGASVANPHEWGVHTECDAATCEQRAAGLKAEEPAAAEHYEIGGVKDDTPGSAYRQIDCACETSFSGPDAAEVREAFEAHLGALGDAAAHRPSPIEAELTADSEPAAVEISEERLDEIEEICNTAEASGESVYKAIRELDEYADPDNNGDATVEDWDTTTGTLTAFTLTSGRQVERGDDGLWRAER